MLDNKKQPDSSRAVFKIIFVFNYFIQNPCKIFKYMLLYNVRLVTESFLITKIKHKKRRKGD